MTNLTSLSRRSFIAMTLALAACKNRRQIIEIVGFSMGTTYTIAAVDHDGLLDKTTLKSAVETTLLDVNKQLSNWDSESEISRVNAADGGASVNLSTELAHVMDASAAIHKASARRFDTTVGPLVDLWGFGAAGTRSMPHPDAVARALDTSGHANTLAISEAGIEKRHAETQVYLAGIGKGRGADRIGETLQSLGITDYMVEIGGDLYVSGRNPDGLPWQIGIESPNPTDRAVLGIVELSGMGLATSGDYRNYFEADGQRYSHLIDPTTGYPVTHRTASATVIADNAMLADAWSTAMLILGREHGLEIANANGVAVQFVDRDARGGTAGFVTTSSEQFLDLTA